MNTAVTVTNFDQTEIAPGVSISKFAFGSAPVAGLFTPVEQDEAVKTIKHAITRGVKYFDSALLYGGGKSLAALGIALGEHPSKDLVISLKVGRILVDGPDDPRAKGKPLHNISGYAGSEHIQYVYDYSAQGMRAAFAQSMDYLNKGRIQQGLSVLTPADLNTVVYAHDPAVGDHGLEGQRQVMATLLKDGFPELKRMQDEQLIKAYGIGTNEIEPCIQALEDPHIKLMLLAGRGTFLCNGAPAALGKIKSDSAKLPALLDKLHTHANAPKLVVASIGNSGLGYGGNTYNYVPADNLDVTFRDKAHAAINTYNSRNGSDWQMKDMLVHYPLRYLHGVVAAVMPGPRSIAEFEETARSYTKTVPDDLWDTLQQQGLVNRWFQRDRTFVSPPARRAI